MKKYLTSLKRCDKISLAAEKAGQIRLILEN